MRRFIRTTINILRQKLDNVTKKFKKHLAPVERFFAGNSVKIAQTARDIAASRQYKRGMRFFKRYSTQTSFGFVIAVFLTVTVGEGQAFTVSTPKVAAQLEISDDSFVSKPEIIGQTVLTGETQQVIIYKVETGDTLTGIANRYSISVGTIIDSNGLKVSEIEKIKPGTELTIPSQDTNTSLAWLEDLNEIKKQEELKRLEAQRSRSVTLPRIAQAIGGVRVLGVYRNLPTYSAYRCQCTQWVQHNRSDLRRRMGNGGQYLSFARSYGIPTGQVARVGAVVVTTEASVGHVAMVVGVGASTITVTEMNYAGPCVVTQRTISKSSPVIRGYVY